MSVYTTLLVILLMTSFLVLLYITTHILIFKYEHAIQYTICEYTWHLTIFECVIW